jgi:hypothetical protein
MNKYGKIDSNIDTVLAFIIIKIVWVNQKVLHHDLA